MLILPRTDPDERVQASGSSMNRALPGTSEAPDAFVSRLLGSRIGQKFDESALDVHDRTRLGGLGKVAEAFVYPSLGIGAARDAP